MIYKLFIITTSRGRDVILGLDKEMNESRNYPPLIKEIERMCSKYPKIRKPEFKHSNIVVASEPTIELHDIRNDDHNKIFPNKLCEFINKHSRDRNSILHCSISGGRKSMSVDMAFALSLFGRENDKLWHVLTHENNEFKGFFPESKKEEKDLVISEIPFVKLRSIIGRETKNDSFKKMNYTDIVNFTQKELKLAFTDKLILDTGKNEITLGENKPFRLEPAAMKLYKFIVDAKMNGEEYVTVENILNNCEHKFTKKSLVEKVNKIRTENFERHIPVSDTDLIGKFIIQGPKVFGTSHYGILADKSKFKIK